MDSPALWSPEDPNLYTSTMPVSYTHLDVYKRQGIFGLRAHTAGKVWIKGQEVAIKQPRDAIQHSVALLLSLIHISSTRS